MFPLPGFLKDNLLRPLQEYATRFSVYAMQTFGIEVFRDGNVIHLEKMDMNVVDACSGLRMLTIFLALSVAIAMIVTTRPWWERMIIVVSAVPVALLVNVIRITITGMLYNLNVREEIAEHFFHDFAGWIMMPMALGFLYLELQILVACGDRDRASLFRSAARQFRREKTDPIPDIGDLFWTRLTHMRLIQAGGIASTAWSGKFNGRAQLVDGMHRRPSSSARSWQASLPRAVARRIGEVVGAGGALIACSRRSPSSGGLTSRVEAPEH